MSFITRDGPLHVSASHTTALSHLYFDLQGLKSLVHIPEHLVTTSESSARNFDHHMTMTMYKENNSKDKLDIVVLCLAFQTVF